MAAIAIVGPLFLLAGCFPAPAPTAGCTAPGTPDALPVMGCSRLTVDQIVSWFNSQSRPAYAASVPIDQLVQYFVNEGWDENVRGDIAFAQAIIETGWFSFPGIVPASANSKLKPRIVVLEIITLPARSSDNAFTLVQNHDVADFVAERMTMKARSCA